MRLDVCRGDGCEQQRHADPVVEPALHVECLPNPTRDAWLGDDRLPEGGVGGRQDHTDDHRFPEGQLPEDQRGRERAEADRQRQPDPEQPGAERDLRRSSLRSMREASENRTSASVASANARTVELVLEMSTSSRTFGPTRIPIETKTIAGVIGVPDRRFETAATAINASATIGNDQSIQTFPSERQGPNLWDARTGLPRDTCESTRPMASDPETDLAARRTEMASERTALAWWRTALTALAVAIGVGRVVPELGPDHDELPYVIIGAAFAAYALLLFVHGSLRARAVNVALDQGRFASTPGWLSVVLALSGVLLCVATLALIIGS